MDDPRVIKAPHSFKDTGRKIFLAGTIDNGNSIDWQESATTHLLATTDYTILNPRRDDWDSSWSPTTDNPLFVEQVEWELRGLKDSAIIIFNFLGGSFSPVTMLELGLCARDYEIYVACDPGFWRRGNVEIVCNLYQVPLYNSLDELLNAQFPRYMSLEDILELIK